MECKTDYNELTRRYNVSQAGSMQENVITRETCDREFKSDSQQFVVVNIAQRQASPRSDDPAVRILGLFPSVDTARAHAQRLKDAGFGQYSLMIFSTCAFSLMPVSEGSDPQANFNKVNNLLVDHWRGVMSSKQSFDRRINKQRAKNGNVNRKKKKNKKDNFTSAPNLAYIAAKEHLTEMGLLEEEEVQDQGNQDQGANAAIETKEAPQQDASTHEELDEDAPTGVQESKAGSVQPSGDSIPPGLRLPEQSVVSISFLKDTIQGTEPGFCVYAAFGTEREEEAYYEQVVKLEVPEHTVSCVSMYEWIYPSMQGHKGIRRDYRMEEEHRLMDYEVTKREQQMTQYKKACVAQGKQRKITEIEADLDEMGNLLEGRTRLEDLSTSTKVGALESSEWTVREVSDEEEDQEDEEVDQDGGVYETKAGER